MLTSLLISVYFSICGQLPVIRYLQPQSLGRAGLRRLRLDTGKEFMEREMRIAFVLREIHNLCKLAIHKGSPRFEKGPKSQLQGGILGYLYHHTGGPVYQKDLEKEFRISRATATNTLQVMEREGLIVRRALDKDARLKRIQMTEEAYQNHCQIEDYMNMMDRRMLEGMSKDETAELRRLLGIVMRNLEALTEEFGRYSGEDSENGRKSPVADAGGCGNDEEPGGMRPEKDGMKEVRGAPMPMMRNPSGENDTGQKN